MVWKNVHFRLLYGQANFELLTQKKFPKWLQIVEVLKLKAFDWFYSGSALFELKPFVLTQRFFHQSAAAAFFKLSLT